MRTYTELLELDTLEERFEYLVVGGTVGEATFGTERYLNQEFYRSAEWRSTRRIVAIRDLGNDLAVDGFPIKGPPYVHHMNPLTMEDIEHGTDNLLNPEFLITCSLRTHNAIHFGDAELLPQAWTPRTPGDTRLWG